MSHEFQSGLFFGENAWHGLGVTLPADSPARFSIESSMEISGLNWQVETMPLFADGKEVVDHKAVVRSDSREVLGVVGNRYQPLQNRQQFEWFKPFLDSGEIAFETCGALKGGTIVWVLAKVNRPDADVGNGDTVRKYLLLTSSHDGSKATSVGFCPIRVVCWNTLSAGLSNRSSTLLKVKHTARQHAALSAIRETVNLLDESFETTAVQYRRLASCTCNRSDIRKYVKLVLELPDDESTYSSRQSNILETVVDRCLHGVGNDGRTAWSAYNGVTEYVTHVYGRNADSRLRSAFYGAGRELNSRAFELALQLAS